MNAYNPPSGYRIPVQPYSRFGYDPSILTLPGMFGKNKALLSGGANGQIRSISRRTAPASYANGGSVPYMCRIFDVAPSDITNIGVDFANWGTSAETAAPGNLSILGASVEYPANTFTVLTFNGGSPTAVGATGADIIGDVVPCQKIPAGATYWIRWLWQSSGNIPYTGPGVGNAQYLPGGDAIEQTATNKVTSGTVNDGGIGIAMYPSVIKSRVAYKVPGVIGDSRECGVSEAQNASGVLGSVCGAISGYTPFLRLAISGEQASQFLANHTHRLAMLKAYTDFTISAEGINDLYGGAAPATLMGYQQSIAALRPGKPYDITTLAPETTSSDSWATLANQTVGSANANVIAYNNLVRALPGGNITGILDLSVYLESSLNSGKWPVTGAANYATSDGVHPSRTINNLIVIPSASIGL